MSARAASVALAALLVALPALAAPGANPRPPLPTIAPVLAVAMADDGTLLAATDDPGTRLPAPGDPGPAVPTWYLWSRTGDLLLQGSSDLPNCDTRLGDLCQSPAPAAAIARTGERFAVGASVADAATDSVKGMLHVGTPSGIIARQALNTCPQPTPCPDAVVAVAMDGDGSSVAALESVAHVNAANTTLVEWFDVGATGTVVPVVPAQALSGLPRGIALSDDGDRLAVAADKLYVYARGAAAPAALGASPATAVAIAGAAPHGVLWGKENGGVDYAIDGSTFASAMFTFGATPVTAVAQSRDGRTGAAGNAAGTVQAYALRGAASPAATAGPSTTVPDPVRQLALTPDGRHLLVRTAAEVRLYAVGAALTLLWAERPATPPSSIALSADAGLAAASVGPGVVTYPVVHAIAADPVAETMLPGQARVITVTYRNDGNRPENATLETWFPGGWFATTTPSNITVPVNGTATVDVRVVVPPLASPATDAVLLNHTIASTGARGSTPLRITVTGRSLVVLDPDGPTSLAIRAGETVEFRAVAENRGNLPAVAHLAATTEPAGWTSVLSADAVALAPGAREGVTIRLTAPAGVVDGDAGHVRVVLAERPQEPLDLYGTVGARFGVRLAAPAAATVQVGNTTEIEVGVENQGNVLDSFDLEVVAAPEGWSFAFANATVREVAAGQLVVTHLFATVPDDATPGLKQRVTVRATSQGNPARASEETLTLTPALRGHPPPPPPSGGAIDWLVVGGIALFVLAVGGFVGGTLLLRRKG